MCSCNKLIPIPTANENGDLMVLEAVCKSCFKKQKTSPMRLEEWREYYEYN